MSGGQTKEATLRRKDMIKAVDTAQFMRKTPTEAEAAFWEIVRGRKINGKKFHRQFPVKFKYENQNRFFFADFYCPESSLIVEIEGGVHQSQIDYEELRAHIINGLGLRVIRFSNEDVLQNLENVIRILEEETKA
jgi:very-short-patch-repair endonuclease